MLPDGSGGLWLTGIDISSDRLWLVHYSRSGRWHAVSISVGGLTRIPGTTTVLGAGTVASKSGPEAAVWATGGLR